MKLNTICRYVLAIALLTLATLMNGCHGVNW